MKRTLARRTTRAGSEEKPSKRRKAPFSLTVPPIARHPAQGGGILGTVRPSSMGCTLTRRHGSRACREAITPAFGSAAASGLSWLLPCPCRSPDTRPLPPSGPPFRVIVGEFARPWGAAKHARALSRTVLSVVGCFQGRPRALPACRPADILLPVGRRFVLRPYCVLSVPCVPFAGAPRRPRRTAPLCPPL